MERREEMERRAQRPDALKAKNARKEVQAMQARARKMQPPPAAVILRIRYLLNQVMLHLFLPGRRINLLLIVEENALVAADKGIVGRGR